MNSTRVILFFCALVMGAFGAGCTASGELGEDTGEQTSPPVQQQDTSSFTAPVARPQAPAQTSRQGFTTREDTIEVESARHNHRSERTPLSVQPRTPLAHPVYSVQVGAFKDEQNATHAKARLERRTKHPVTKRYDEAARLYRVTAGEFTTQTEARRFAASIRKQYPREYGQAWVVRLAE